MLCVQILASWEIAFSDLAPKHVYLYECLFSHDLSVVFFLESAIILPNILPIIKS